MITAPSRTVNDLVGVSEPVVGSTARPSVSSVSTPRSGSSQSAMTTVLTALRSPISTDHTGVRLDAPAVGEDDHLLPWKARYTEPIGQRGGDQRQRRASVDENVQILLVDRGQLHGLINVTHACHVARKAPEDEDTTIHWPTIRGTTRRRVSRSSKAVADGS